MHSPSPADRLWRDAEAAADRKQWAIAEQTFRRALALEGAHVPALIGLSTVLSRRDAHREAHAAAMAALGQDPQFPALRYALAQRLRAFHEFAAMERMLAHPALAAGAPVDVLARSVVMLSSVGAHAQAVALTERALQRDPKHAPSWYVRGNLRQFEGQVEEAERSYETALRLDPRLFQAAWMLANARTQTSENNHVGRLRQQLSQATPGGEGEGYAAFGLHKELHDLGEYEQAWTALARGCAVKRGLMPYSLANDRAVVDALIGLCTPAFLHDRTDVAQPSVPIFIVGMHRSGTTLLERILSGHSQVGDAGETSALDAQMHLATDHMALGQPDVELVRRAAQADFDQVAASYARHVPWLSRGKPFFTEKLPMNFWNVGFIARALPQARVLHLVRDPMDTCFSNLRTLFSGVAAYSYVQEELGAFYLQYRRLMAHWHTILPDLVLDVSYDALVADPEAMAMRVAAHCGLPYEPGMVDVSRSGGRVATASASLARQGIRRDRGQVWRHYEQQLEPLRAVLAPLYG